MTRGTEKEFDVYIAERLMTFPCLGADGNRDKHIGDCFSTLLLMTNRTSPMSINRNAFVRRLSSRQRSLPVRCSGNQGTTRASVASALAETDSRVDDASRHGQMPTRLDEWTGRASSLDVQRQVCAWDRSRGARPHFANAMLIDAKVRHSDRFIHKDTSLMFIERVNTRA